MTILIVEDYLKINQLIARFARDEGFDVSQAFNAEDAFKLLNKEKFDVIILDLMLPNMQGETFIKRVREVSDIYIMVLSAKVEVSGRIDVLSMGADDYMTKPFSIEEIIAKLKNIEKRLVINSATILSFNQEDLEIHPLSREVFFRKQVISFTAYEYNILYYLSSHPNTVFTRDQIIENCFDDSDAFDRVVDVFIKNIRKKISPENEDFDYIKTQYGVGYKFVGIKDE